MQPALMAPADLAAGGSPASSDHAEQQEPAQDVKHLQLPVHMAPAGAIGAEVYQSAHPAHLEHGWHPMAPLQQQPGLFLQQRPAEGLSPAAVRYSQPPLPPPSAVGYINQVCQKEFCCELHLLPKSLRPKLMAQAMQNIYMQIWPEQI
jgi:hypothetical protein